MNNCQEQNIQDIKKLIAVFPQNISIFLEANDRLDKLIEIVMDLGRQPIIRYTDRDIRLAENIVSADDLACVVSHISTFGKDNRAGIEGTLHRISAIKNRNGEVVGITARVGRAVYGTTDIIRDLIDSGKSILLLGRPGIGKTTMLREAARIMAEKKRVIIVDTSNEIAGDGNIPHPGIGDARRMQVPTPELQHEVMIEAVENHQPEVIIIDEIGRELETVAARTIAERGVQLVATAHGLEMVNVIKNPTLSDLIGGIESVTLSDEEAAKRGTQKSVLERKNPPTFDILVEIRERNVVVVYDDVANAIDMIVRGKPYYPVRRTRHENGEITYEKAESPKLNKEKQGGTVTVKKSVPAEKNEAVSAKSSAHEEKFVENKPDHPYRFYLHGVDKNKFSKTAASVKAPVSVVSKIEDAEFLLTTKSCYKERQYVVTRAEDLNKPIYVIKANDCSMIKKTLFQIFDGEK